MENVIKGKRLIQIKEYLRSTEDTVADVDNWQFYSDYIIARIFESNEVMGHRHGTAENVLIDRATDVLGNKERSSFLPHPRS